MPPFSPHPEDGRRRGAHVDRSASLEEIEFEEQEQYDDDNQNDQGSDHCREAAFIFPGIAGLRFRHHPSLPPEVRAYFATRRGYPAFRRTSQAAWYTPG